MSESTKIIRCTYCNFVNKINYKGETEIFLDGSESYKTNLRTFIEKRLQNWGLDIGKDKSSWKGLFRDRGDYI